MDIKITVDEKEIAKIVEEIIAKEIFKKYSSAEYDAKYGLREGTDKAIKAYIYSRKEEIIERCVARASAELVRKGLPKLLEREL